jgi:hypothetical protein
MFRGDVRRSSSAKVELLAKIGKAWSVKLDGALSQPVVANGLVYVVEKDAHTVHALAMGTGKEIWAFMADGRIDSSPTCYKGTVLFGTRNGSVYCITADTGELAWKFKAAPSGEQLTAYGQLESVWPVHGSVLVENEKLYFTAGRSMNLDSGIYVYELDPVTGEVLNKELMSAKTEPKGELSRSSVSDILSSDGQDVFMRGIKISPVGLEKKRGSSKGYLRPTDGGLLDNTMFMSSYRSYGGVQAQLLVFDEREAFGLMAQKNLTAKSYGQAGLKLGAGYGIFAVDLSAKQPAQQSVDRKGKKKKKKATSAKKKWASKIPVRADSIVLTDNYICYAGAPDLLDEEDPWAPFEDRKGGVLLLVDRADGKTVAECKLESSPIFDGMSAAQGSLFVSLKNGELQCWK